jgi:tetratricopeptide (TPR) repeat protein
MRPLDRNLLNSILILFFTLTGTINLHAQTSTLEVIGTAENNLQPIVNAKATIYKDGTKGQTIFTNDKGEFRFAMEVNKEYVIEVEKSGFLSKKIAFNTEVPADVTGRWTMEFAMTLFPGCEGVNATVLAEPVDRIKYSTNKADFISDEAYVSKIRSRIEQLLTDIDQCKADKFRQAMDEGNKLANQKKYEEARANYEKALDIFPDDKTAQRKITDLDKASGLDKKNEQQYNAAILEADRLFAAKDYEAAKIKYNDAQRASPQNGYPGSKITEINTLIQQRQQQSQAKSDTEKKYNDLITQANSAFASKNYEAAKEYFKQASEVKPDASLPRQKMSELDPLIAQQKKETQENAAADKAYNEAMAMGQSALQNNDYDGAKQHFKRASMIKPSESLPQQKINEIDQKVKSDQLAQMQVNKATLQQKITKALDEGDDYLAQKNLDAAEAAYHTAVELDPNDAYAKQQLNKVKSMQSANAAQKQQTIEKEYKESVNEGDRLLAAASYQQAVEAYKQALIKKPDDLATKNKLAAAEQQLAIEQQKRNNDQIKKKQYDDLLVQGNSAYTAKQYADAKQAYQSALNLYPDQSFPRTKIQEIDKLLADQQKEGQYKDLISKADVLFAGKSYDQAKTIYQQALVVNPVDTYAKQKITEIDNINRENQRVASEQKARDDQYKTALLQGDNLLAQSKLPESKAAYQQALTIKPAETYPQQQITKIEGLIAEQVRKENEKKSLDQQYANLILKADGFMTAKDYGQAKTLYQQASVIKPTEVYPKQRVSEIDGIIKVQENAIAQQKARDEQYKTAVQQGDNLLAQSKWPESKLAYQQALTIKPAETYPQQQITKIDGLIAEQIRKENEKKSLDQQYANLIIKADGFMTAKDYGQAKTLYQQALALKSTETYPRQKIIEIDGIAQREQEKAAADQKARDDQYKKSILEADNLFATAKLDEAKAAYQKALGIKPLESYPASQITKIDVQIANRLQQANDQKAKDFQYNTAINQADQFYNQNKLAEARSGYQSALLLKPGEAYPTGQITKIDSQLALIEKGRQEKAAFEQKYNSLITSADQAYDQRDYPTAKSAYMQALNLKPAEKYPQERLNKIAEFERIIAQQDANRKTVATNEANANVTNSGAPAKLTELKFANDSEREKYLKALRNKYPVGVTLETYKDKTFTTYRYIVIRGEDVREFRKVQFSWGGVDFSENGIPTTGQYFDTQVKARSGEFFQEFNF